MTAGGRMGRTLDVLVYGGADRVTALGRGLERLALRPRTLRRDHTRPAEGEHWAACILLVENASELEDGLACVQRVTGMRTPVVVVSPTALEPDERIDAWLRDPAPPVQIASRVRALYRLYAMETVAERRGRTAALYGERPAAPTFEDETRTILFVGEATPRFMTVQHALRSAGADVIAAFSSYSAFDYLHERSFDAVILNAIGKPDSAFTIASAMRRNARLYHTPVLLLSDDSGHEAAEEAYARGVSDILPMAASEEEIRERVLSLAGERRRRRIAKASLESCRDPRSLEVETGLFHQGFIASHLQDLITRSARDGGTLSLCLLSAETPDGQDAPDQASAEKARRQFAAMLRHLLRAEDAAARIESDGFLAVLPYTDKRGADCVAARVAAIAECTAFESADPLRPFRLAVRSASIEIGGEETAEAAIERAQRLLSNPGGAADSQVSA